MGDWRKTGLTQERKGKMTEQKQLNVLLIGGSGFLSGTLAREAVRQGHQVWAVTRGQRPAPEGVQTLTADRKDQAAFQQAIEQAGVNWDLVVDCIAFDAEDTRQDVDVFRDRSRQLVMISTDFVYDPQRRIFPQPEIGPYFQTEGYGGKKRAAELALTRADVGPLVWTILRPGHIYGPGSRLGCLPEAARDPQLIQKLRQGETLRLVGGGYFLQQPVFVQDLARTILSCAGNPAVYGQIFNVAGPEMVEARQYYKIIADVLETQLVIAELPVYDYRLVHPESEPFLAHRIYDLTQLRTSGASVPGTTLEDGLRQQVESLLAAEEG